MVVYTNREEKQIDDFMYLMEGRREEKIEWSDVEDEIKRNLYIGESIVSVKILWIEAEQRLKNNKVK